MAKVVVVEDEAIVKKGLILTTDWEKLGCRVVGEASNGQEGIEAIRRLQPDIVLADVRMPGMNGIEMITALAGEVDTEYIILSAYSEFDYAQKAMGLGVQEYLVKPIDDAELENAILRVIRRIEAKHRVKMLENHMLSAQTNQNMQFREYSVEGKTSQADSMNKAVHFIKEHYAEDISIRDVADAISVSDSYIGRLFRKESGYTFNDYLTHYRVRQACRLLEDPQIKVYEVAEKVGYKSQQYFAVVFKKIVGKTPGEFKERGI